MAKWYFNATDNGGKVQSFTVTAPSKTEAINKGFEKAKKKAVGDITTWRCTLKSA
jgi:hypothetical protein